jgi:GTPase
VLQGSLDPIDARVPYSEGQLISIFHEQGAVDSVEHEEKGVRLKGRVPTRLYERFKPYLIKTRRRNTS